MSKLSNSSANSRWPSRRANSAAQQEPMNKKSLRSLLSTALSLSPKAFGKVKLDQIIEKALYGLEHESVQDLRVQHRLRFIRQLMSVIEDLITAVRDLKATEEANQLNPAVQKVAPRKRTSKRREAKSTVVKPWEQEG